MCWGPVGRQLTDRLTGSQQRSHIHEIWMWDHRIGKGDLSNLSNMVSNETTSAVSCGGMLSPNYPLQTVCESWYVIPVMLSHPEWYFFNKRHISQTWSFFSSSSSWSLFSSCSLLCSLSSAWANMWSSHSHGWFSSRSISYWIRTHIHPSAD